MLSSAHDSNLLDEVNKLIKEYFDDKRRTF